MNDLIVAFLETAFTEEFRNEVAKSFSLFDFFEHNDAYSGFIDILVDESFQDKETLSVLFVRELNKQIDFVFQQHQIKLVDHASVHEKNELLYALASVQHLEDYRGIIGVLESLEPDEEQFSSVFSDLCMLDQSKIMELVEYFNPRILQNLKDFIYKKEESEEKPEPVDRRIVNNLKLFNDVFGKEHLAAQLLESDFRIGEKFSTYIDYIRDVIISDKVETTALNVLSVLYLSSDGFNDVLLTYRKNSEALFQNLDTVSRVEVAILNHIGKFNEYKKAVDEKARLS